MRISSTVLSLVFSASLLAQTPGTVVDYPVNYPNETTVTTGACHPAPKGSTHEITFNAKGGKTLWITGQNYDSVVEMSESGAMKIHPMPEKADRTESSSTPIAGLWVTFEFAGQIVRLDANGKRDLIVRRQTRLSHLSSDGKINTQSARAWPSVSTARRSGSPAKRQERSAS
jgi:virginiamycin B lyase